MTRSSDRPIKLLIVIQHRFDLWNCPGWLPQRLKGDFPSLDIVHLPTYNGIERQIEDAEILFTWSIRSEQIRHASQLRWIHSPAAAVHLLMIPEVVSSDIVVTNARDVHAPIVAEHVMALIFALARSLPRAMRLQEQRVWGQEALWRSHPQPREVNGATLGLIGLGSIGREVAKKADALGMRVIAVRENPQKTTPTGVQLALPPSRLDEVLGESDYVVLAAPLTADTKHLIDAARLSKMKPNACLINVGRGPLVDIDSLAAALRSGVIGGAALDVFEKEPLPQDSPLWNLENLLITPHMAALAGRLWERHYGLIHENLRRYIDGHALLGVVDKRKGY